MHTRLNGLFIATLFLLLVLGISFTNEIAFAEEENFSIATGYDPVVSHAAPPGAGQPTTTGRVIPVTLQDVTPGNEEIGNFRISGVGLVGTSIGIGVLYPQGIFDAGERVDPVGAGCPAGYLFVDYDANGVMDLGECWRGMVIKGGNVGIGTINPAFNLEVIGTARISVDLQVPTINGQVPLFTETDPTVESWVKNGIDWTELTGIPADIADGDQVGILTETDSTVLNSVKDGVSWAEVTDKPSGFADNVDNVGLLVETDPQVGANTLNIVAKWDGSALVSGSIYDETGKVGMGTTNPKGALDISSTTGGLVIPRMTTAQREALNPVNGTLIFNITTGQFEGFDGTDWLALINAVGTPEPTPTPIASPTPTPAPVIIGPYITSPIHESVVESSIIEVTWINNNTEGVTEYWLYAGTTPTLVNIFKTNFTQPTTVSFDIGSYRGRIYFKLWWRIGDNWENKESYVDTNIVP